MDEIKRIINPLGRRIRRAVLTETGLLADQAEYPSLPEIDVLSELCSRVFANTEPRHPPLLLQRAFKFNVPTAWAAIYDDLCCNIPLDASTYIDDYTAHLLQATDWKHMYVVASLAANTAGWKVDDTGVVDSLICKFIRFMDVCDRNAVPDVIEVLQKVVCLIRPSVDAMYRTIMETPSSAGLFIRHMELGHLAMKVGVGHCVCEYAATRRVEDRYHALAFVAKLIQQGHRVQHPVGLDTLTSLSSKRFDIHLAAAAAAIAREDDHPVTCHLARLIESLAATIHSYVV